jgi:hypothetical protein
MAGVASHGLLPIEVVAVDGSHHLHHLPRGLLRFLVIFLQSTFDVAVTAFHPERVSDELHCRDQLVRRNFLQYLNVLIGLGCRLTFKRRGVRCCRLRVRHQHEGKCNPQSAEVSPAHQLFPLNSMAREPARLAMIFSQREKLLPCWPTTRPQYGF